MKKTGFLIGVFLFFNSFTVNAAPWDFNEKSVAAAIAREEKAENPVFNGTKFIISGLGYLDMQQEEVSDLLRCCRRPSVPEQYIGLTSANIYGSFDRSEIDYMNVSFTPWATLWRTDNYLDDSLNTKQDMLEMARLRYIKDDSLEVKSYLELSIFKAGRLIEYGWSAYPAFKFNAALHASTGWSWAESQNSSYSTVSNPFAGIYYDIGIEHASYGRLYIRNRFVNGFSFSNPSRGHPTVREASARFGYAVKLQSCMAIDVYVEKRSFYFDEGDLLGLYTKNGMGVLELSCRWF